MDCQKSLYLIRMPSSQVTSGVTNFAPYCATYCATGSARSHDPEPRNTPEAPGTITNLMLLIALINYLLLIIILHLYLFGKQVIAQLLSFIISFIFLSFYVT